MKTSEPRINLWPGTVFLAALVLLSPLGHGGEGYRTVLWIRPVVIGFALYYFLWVSGKDRLEFKVPAGGWLLLGFFICLTASFITTHYYFLTIYWYFNLLACLILFLIGLGLFSGATGPALINALLIILLCAGLIESGIGILEHFGSHPDRAAATFFNPAYYAGYLAGLFAFPLAILVFGDWPGMPAQRRVLIRAGAAALVALMFLAMVFSASRTIIFAAIPLLLILVIRFRSWAVGVIAALVVAMVLVPNPLRTRVMGLKQDPLAWERVGIWRTSLNMIAHHPAGVGLGQYGFYYQRHTYPLPNVKYGRYGKMASQSHNEFLNFAAECSPLAPLCALAFLVSLFPRALRAMKAARGEPGRTAQLAGFSGSVLAILGHSLVDFNLHQPPIAIMFALGLAALTAIIGRNDPALIRTRIIPLKRPRLFRLSAMAVGLGLAFLISYQALFIGLLSGAISQKDPEQVLQSLTWLSWFPSGYAPIHAELGSSLEKGFETTGDEKQAAEAIRSLEHAVKLNPENHKYYYQLARSYYNLGRHQNDRGSLELAQANAKTAIDRAPGQVFSYLVLSNIYAAQNNYPAATQAIRTALEYEPYFLRGRFQLLKLLLHENAQVEMESQINLLVDQDLEVKEFEKTHPTWLDDYQRSVAALPEKDLNRALMLLE